MITPKQISEIVQQPHLLYNYSVQDLQQLITAYPYNSLVQHLYALHSQQQATKGTIAHLYPIHPTLAYILRQESAQNYSYYDATLSNVEVMEITVDDNLANNEVAEVTPPAENDETAESDWNIPIEEVVNDYFSTEEVSNSLPDNVSDFLSSNDSVEADLTTSDEEDKSLMRVMSFNEWLSFLATKNKKDKAEEESKKSLRLMWQKEKLSKAIEEETEEIPEEVFNMAVNSITAPDDLSNESMAEVYTRQGKYQKAIEIYQKLSLLHPEKNTYFASKIEKLKKEL